MHNPFRACLVLPDGHMTLWDYKHAPFLAAHNPLVAELRSGASFIYSLTGEKTADAASAFVAEVADVLNAKEQTREVGGKRFTVHSVTKTDGETYNVQMTLFRGEMGEEDWAWFRYPYGRVRLMDAKGRDLSTSSGGGGGGNDKAEFSVQYRREAVGAVPADQPGEPFALAPPRHYSHEEN